MTNPEPQRAGVRKKRWMVCFENAILEQDLSIYEKMVYIVLCSHAKKDGPAFPSVMTIASEASCSRTKVFEALKVLEDRGVITRDNRIFPKRGQTSNLYEITDIEPRPRNGRGEGNPPSLSAARTGESVSRTGVVRGADAPLNVFELDPLNITKEHTPIAPQGVNTEISETDQSEPEMMTQGQREPEPPARNVDCHNPKAAASQPGKLIETILAAYNDILPELPEAGSVTPSREKAVKRRIREDGKRSDLKWWERYFSRVREFPWLMGSNPSSWRACFDWLIGEKGMLKVLEGGFGRFSPPPRDNGAELGTEWGYELQRRFTNANGVVDARALLRYLDEIETA
ncbi:MAG: helix-turn-helix domain-containing protein [Synergistaceae bacterium]|nr:helix-turn-helix domain-containing protein [Synergistaceae bacterium]